MSQSKIKVRTKTQSYNIIIGNNLIKNLSKILKDNSVSFNKCLLVIDKKVPKKYVKKINFLLKKKIKHNYTFNPTEINKNQKTVNKLINILLKKNFHRNDLLISIGGGIVGDVSAFVASIFKRGIKFVNIPTTLLAQVDSSIGGKAAINSEKYGKNLIGSFYQPHLVISDTLFLQSLPKREIICGYAEILKHSLIMSKKFFTFLDKNTKNIIALKKPFIEKAIIESCLIKKRIVEKDEKEKNIRQLLNFGHTFAHAFEATNRFSKKLNHGEAVLLGMICALNFSHKKKYINKNNLEKIKGHYKKINLPRNLKNYYSVKNIKKIISFMKKDKKNNSSKISLVLLKKIGVSNYNNKFDGKDIYKFFKEELTN